jgi:hypothetical protein
LEPGPQTVNHSILADGNPFRRGERLFPDLECASRRAVRPLRDPERPWCETKRLFLDAETRFRDPERPFLQAERRPRRADWSFLDTETPFRRAEHLFRRHYLLIISYLREFSRFEAL